MSQQTECTLARHVFIRPNGRCECGQMQRPHVSEDAPKRNEPWALIIVFVVSMSIVAFWQYKWLSVPCSSFKTNPILRDGNLPARCAK